MKNILGLTFLNELETEVRATRRCLERIPDKLFNWKPHKKSMSLGVLAYLVADIPQWIQYMIEKGDIDFATYPRFEVKTTTDLVKYFDKNVKAARKALQGASDKDLNKSFSLKNNGQVLFTTTKKENIPSSINHWVHHRGQLTVFMRLKDIPVPSIYGPSADDKSF